MVRQSKHFFWKQGTFFERLWRLRATTVRLLCACLHTLLFELLYHKHE